MTKSIFLKNREKAAEDIRKTGNKGTTNSLFKKADSNKDTTNSLANGFGGKTDNKDTTNALRNVFHGKKGFDLFGILQDEAAKEKALQEAKVEAERVLNIQNKKREAAKYGIDTSGMTSSGVYDMDMNTAIEARNKQTADEYNKRRRTLLGSY